MRYSEFKRHVGKAGLTLAGFARIIGVAPNSVTNYAFKDSVPTHYAVMAVLMGEAAERGVKCESLLAEYGIRPTPSGNLSHIDSYRRRRAGEEKA